MIRLYSFHACDACAVDRGRHMSDKHNPGTSKINASVWKWWCRCSLVASRGPRIRSMLNCTVYGLWGMIILSIFSGNDRPSSHRPWWRESVTACVGWKGGVGFLNKAWSESQQQRMRGGGSSGGISGSGWRDRMLLDSSLLGTSRGIWGKTTFSPFVRSYRLFNKWLMCIEHKNGKILLKRD